MQPSLIALMLTLSLSAGDKKLAPTELARLIDEHIDARLRAARVVPAPPASDAELVRRLYLDLNGRIPDILAARDFIDRRTPNKRPTLIRKLLTDPEHVPMYARHWANVWRNWLIPTTNDLQVSATLPALETWLRDRLNENASYAQIVRELIIVDATRGRYGSNGFVFYQSNQFRPENLAGTTTRLFLGVKLECAQCHNHPFAKWDKKQFWEMAAFFGGNVGIGEPGFRGLAMPGTGEITIPNTDKKVKARFLDGTSPIGAVSDYRVALVDWMTKKDNPYFARAMANRIWENLMGVGLVEPLDEEGPDNLPSHPKLLDLLAKQFAAHDFDLKYLIHAIVLSNAYQRTSQQTHPSQADETLFARQKVRGLTPEQLFDSLALATGKDSEPAVNPALAGRPFGPQTPRSEFLRRFANQDKRSEQETSILQALYLMNGNLVDEATSLTHNRNLAIIAQADTIPTARRVQQLFLIVLSRKPTEEESARLVRYVDSGGPTKDSARALCDVFWALLNTTEFCTNH